MAEKLFYFLSFLAILSAIMVVVSKNPVHSVLYLILTFFTLSGHYILLNAQFISIVNLIVYAGAIMVLFLFTIMFLNLKDDEFGGKRLVFNLVCILLTSVLAGLMISKLAGSPIPVADEISFDSQIGMVENLGKVLFNSYLIPFELVSVLFLSAMVGAVMLGRREKGERNF
ncbi:MAG TPA: NADH-quinone oxidoreductase subunit J [Catalimonadaceae bacterium]|jgi:NADH-quinone oxidoreductase subunit J|nr:NADH-quinone oxidoreductase subunit J [Catalimonadaceae bacterium]